MGRASQNWTAALLSLMSPHSSSFHYLLVSKYCFPTYMLPTYTQPATFTISYRGNWHHCISRTQGSIWSIGNRMCKPAESVPPRSSTTELILWSLCGKSDPRTTPALRPVSLEQSWHHSHGIALLCAHAGNQATKSPLQTDLVLWIWASRRATELYSLKPMWEIRSLPPHTWVNPRIQALLLCGAWKHSLLHQRARMPVSPLRGGRL
jgi:hypothetical protein